MLAFKFLYKTLPFLVEVLLQGGIYFTTEFPNHPMSQYIVVSFFRSSREHEYRVLFF